MSSIEHVSVSLTDKSIATWQTDTGTACARTAGPCATYPADATKGCNLAAYQFVPTMLAATDSRRIFHETLACGIRTACNARCQMDNCKWLEYLSPASTGPYLQNQAPWPALIASCDALGAQTPGRIVFCATRLATHNIRTDLTEALVEYGCGTQSDWDLIQEVNFSIRSQCLPEAPPRTRYALSLSMKAVRTETRRTCIERRTAAGLDPFINNELRGKTCGS